jgi:DNA-binding CsgD family transcriptional regulator/tetratricopeptide (TPR) repeat protein
MAEEPVLFGRQVETATIDALLHAAATGTSGALVLLGEAGIGKTALLDHAARRSGTLRLLRAEGVEPEADLPFGGLHRLLLPVLDSIGALPSSQAAAISAALGIGPGNGDRFLVGAGVLSLLSEVSGTSGVLCLVDNAHWLDPESADALAFAARRLVAEAAVVLFAARPTGGLLLSGIATLPLAGLAGPDAGSLLRHSAEGLAGSVVDSVVRTSAGNPQALLELPAAMTAAQRTGAEPLPAELPLGERVQAAMMLRVAGLPETTRRLLLVVATDPAADLATLTAAATGLGLDLADLEPAERGGLVSTTAAGVRFGSPLLRSAVYADATFLRRRAVHSALAETLHGSHPDRWAWHQAAIAQGPDPVLAGELERSAQRARDRAGHAATAAALERAAELSSDGPHRARRLVAAATSAWEAGQAERAERLATRAEELTLTPDLSGRLFMVRGLIQTHRGRPPAGLQLLQTAAELLAVDDAELSMTALTAAVEAAMMIGDFSGLPRMAELAVTVVAGGPETGPAAAAGLISGLAQLVQGDSAAGTASLRSFVDLVDPSDAPRVVGCRAAAAGFLGDEATALRLYSRAIAAARAVGAVSSLPWLLEQRAVIEATNCQLLLAQADASEAVRLIEELGADLPPLVGLASLTWVAAMRGEDDQARLLADRVLVGAQQHGLTLPVGLVAAALMELDLARGRIESATARAVELADSARTMHPLVTILTTPTRVEIMLRAGHPPPAADLAAHRAWAQGSPNPASRAVAVRCEAIVADPDAAGTLFEESLRLHGGTNRPYDQARTRLLYGEFLRRHRHPVRARVHLRAAADTFARLGCQAWAERARAELRAAGETTTGPARDGFTELTPQELQIVRLVSEGLSNRQVAEQLFLSPRTVEYHLYKVYPKLGIGSRTDLIRRWSKQVTEPAAS